MAPVDEGTGNITSNSKPIDLNSSSATPTGANPFGTDAGIFCPDEPDALETFFQE